MAIEQCHAMGKGSGEAFGLMGNPGALRRWVRAELARIITEFEREEATLPQNRTKVNGDLHHGQLTGVEKKAS